MTRVDVYKQNDIILPCSRRSLSLCVVWEGTCSEKPCAKPFGLNVIKEHRSKMIAAVWYAGDWTGPISLQPDRSMSGESSTSLNHDMVAISFEGVKVISVEFSGLHSILKAGSPLYQKYLTRQSHQEREKLQTHSQGQAESMTDKLLRDARKELNILDLLNCNSALRKLSAVQKRHLECLAEGPTSYQPGERIWKAGSPVEKAFVIVSGSASFVQPRKGQSKTTQSPIHEYDVQVDLNDTGEKLACMALSNDEAVSHLSIDLYNTKPNSISLDRGSNL